MGFIVLLLVKHLVNKKISKRMFKLANLFVGYICSREK